MTQPFTSRAIRLLTVTALVLALLFVAFTFVFSLLTYNSAASQRAQILSCTTPQGSCYQRGQKQTGQAVASINKVVVAAAECAKRYEVEHDIEVCIRRKVMR